MVCVGLCLDFYLQILHAQPILGPSQPSNLEIKLRASNIVTLSYKVIIIIIIIKIHGHMIFLSNLSFFV